MRLELFDFGQLLRLGHSCEPCGYFSLYAIEERVQPVDGLYAQIAAGTEQAGSLRKLIVLDYFLASIIEVVNVDYFLDSQLPLAFNLVVAQKNVVAFLATYEILALLPVRA